MTEMVFIVEEDVDGGFTARAASQPIFTAAENMDELKQNIREAVECHFENPEDRPKIICLHTVRDKVLAL
ncbi:MAG: 2-oxoisovalerate dehydrogenase [Chloroflexi bacterium]|nr:2-oxoisovalerate dehydrogenase [Chloroflexota bacterium]